MADFEEAGDDDVFRKVRTDFEAKGVAQSEHQIRRTMDELMERRSPRSRPEADGRAGRGRRPRHTRQPHEPGRIVLAGPARRSAAHHR